jgi:zinc/manganese transport system ATP-binding protein
MPTSSAIEIIASRGLAASYGGRTIWSGADFTVKAGEFIAILGPNGAGKSTLLKMLLGLLLPDAGELRVLGETPRRGNPAIGYVPQALSMDPETAVRGIDLVGFGIDGTTWGIPLRGRIDTRVVSAIRAVGAAAYADRRLGQLSGGERQRLLLAQALVGNPKLLLLDEPLASLDLKNQTAVAELVGSVARARNLAVLLVTHDLNPLLPVVNRVLYIAKNGVTIGRPDEVINADVLSKLYGTSVEVLVDRQGRRFIVGLEDVVAHPHAHI